MGNGFIAFLLSAGAAAWIYNKLMRSTGGNTQNAIIASLVSGVLLFVLTLILLSFIPN
ncbi:MAG: hypothetical protein M3Q36_00690 [bacterium]|nr:hypothetical protein [bacterium]